MTNLPAHLTPECGNGVTCSTYHAPVRQNAATGRWFITLGHAGFNSPANNGKGYATLLRAAQAYRRYLQPRKAAQ